MLQLIGYRKAGMSFNYVTSVECQKIHKKSKKFPVTFELLLNWSDGQRTIIERPYIAVFDFMNILKKMYPDSSIPDLKDAKWFESLWKARKEEKKKVLDEFFQKILSLSERIVHGKEISEFFAFYWPRDSTSEMMRRVSEEAEARIHSTAVISPVESEYESVDIERSDYSLLSIKPKSISVFQNRISNDSNGGYWAVTEYSKRKSGEVNLLVGAAVSVLQRELSGWWFVHVEDTNEQGWAPAVCLLPDDRSNLQDCKMTGSLGEFQALRDFEGIEPDEVSCKKGEKVEVIEASLDGWWKVRCRGRVGIIPATYLEPVANKTTLRNSLYHQVGIYKKESPPPRRNSKLSVEELYSKVDIFRKNTKPTTNSAEVASESSKAEAVKMSLGSPQDEQQKTDADDADDNQHFYMNDSVTPPSQHSYVNVELKPKKSASSEIEYYKIVARHEPSIEHHERPVLIAGVGDIIESHVEETDEIYGRLYQLADSSSPNPDSEEGWISKSCLELYELELKDVMKREIQTPDQGLSNGIAQHPIPPKRIPPKVKPAAALDTKSLPKPLQLPCSKSTENQSTADLQKDSESDHAAKAFVASKASVSSQSSSSHVGFSVPLQYKIHRMSRIECENILLKSATRCQFVIRKSTKAGHFALSVCSINRIHHFPIELTPEKKYFIGQYNFDSLEAVISYYSQNPLFESEDGTGVTLGTSLDSY